jgi:hypothetical protein
MRYQRFLIALFAFVLLLSACHEKTTPDSPEKLFEQYHNSVVLIRTQFYLQTNLANGLKGYVCMSEDGQYPIRTTDESLAKQNSLTAYGTGFFISTDGKIATNRHVAFPQIEEGDLAKIRSYFDDNKTGSSKQEKIYTDSIAEISNYIEEHANTMTPEEAQTIEEKKQALVDAKAIIENTMESISQNLTEDGVEVKLSNIEIAYDKTFVDKPGSYYNCSVLEKSNTDAIDLAIIQLNDRKTPSTVTKIFDFEEHNPNIKHSSKKDSISGQLKIDEKLYMIGFNYGESLAKTSTGISVQFTQGSVSQESDDYRVLYSIPSLHGSSGSPVIDQWGNLVAINYAGVDNTQSFNYGILVKHLKNMAMNESAESNTHAQAARQSATSSYNNSPKTPSVDFPAKIKAFVNLEESRNFEAIYQAFDPNMRRYWDLKNPTKDELQKRYEHSWTITTQSKNEVEKIVKVDAFTYDLYANYTFTNTKGETKSLKTVVRYEFDSFGKIVETYGR